MAFQKPIPMHKLGFCPDLPPSTQGIVYDSDGMYPTPSGAAVLPSFVVQSNALPDPPVGAFLARTSGGGLFTIAGTAKHLYRLIPSFTVVGGNGLTYDAFAAKYHQYQNLPRLRYNDPFFTGLLGTVSPGPVWVDVAAGFTFQGTAAWSFDQAADDILATNGIDPVQVFTLTANKFAPLGGNPPAAKFVAVCDPGAGQGFVVLLANLATNAAGWVASKPGNDTVWSLNVNDLSASGFLQAEPGPITGWKTVRTFVAGFKETSLYVGKFTGVPFPWTFEPISHQIGCRSNGAIVDAGDLLVFPGPDDFYAFDGYSLNPIPNFLRRWFFGVPGQANSGMADQRYLQNIQGRYDNTTQCAYWHFSSVNANPPGTLDMWLSWNKTGGKWLVGHTSVAQVLNVFGTSAFTYDQFAARTLYGQYQSLPHLTYADVSFQPTPARNQAVILPDGKLYSYTGPASSGYIRFGDLGDPVRLTRINRMRVLFGTFPKRNQTGARAFLSSFVRMNTGDGDGFTPFKSQVPLSDTGFFDFVEEAWWHQLRMDFQSDAEIQAFALDVSDAGRR